MGIYPGCVKDSGRLLSESSRIRQIGEGITSNETGEAYTGKHIGHRGARTPRSTFSPVRVVQCRWRCVKGNRSQHEGSATGELPEGLPGSLEHGMYVEKRRRTWEALSSPVGCAEAAESVGLTKGKRGRPMDRMLKGFLSLG